MDRGKYKAGRLNKGLREIAEELGYTPGEFSMYRMAKDTAKVREWMEAASVGQVHGDFAGMKLSDFNELVSIEMKDLMRRERDWAPFFYPTLKSQDMAVTEPVEMVIRWENEKS